MCSVYTYSNVRKQELNVIMAILVLQNKIFSLSIYFEINPFQVYKYKNNFIA